MSSAVHWGDSRFLDWPAADVMITDPPYAKTVHDRTTRCAAHGKRKGVRQNNLGFDHLTSELRAWTCQLAAQVRTWSVIFSDIESVGIWVQELELAGATYIRAIPWVRWSMPQLSGDRPPQGAEMIVIAWGAQRGKKSWYGPRNLTHFAHKCLRGEGKHRAEKPLDLALDLVEYFSSVNDLVIDPFAGSGTFPKAALLLDRRAQGAEQDVEWSARADERCISIRLGDRDAAALERYKLARDLRAEDRERCRAHTAGVRAKYEAGRALE